MSNNLGATAEEWSHFATALSLSCDLLPCVPAASDVRVYPGSALEGKVGKIPSVLDPSGVAFGLKQWQRREILPEELAEWSKDARYNLCVRTGTSATYIYALDVDVEDVALSKAIENAIIDVWPGDMEWRTRTNSAKFLLPFRMNAPAPWKKRILNTASGRIELLGNGQQFVAAGTHSSGVRYQWSDGLPKAIPELSTEQAEKVWSTLKAQFSVGGAESDSATDEADERESDEPYQTLTTISNADWYQLLDALDTLAPTCDSNDKWSEVGYALLSLKDSRPEVEKVWIEFSQKAPKNEPGAAERWWNNHVSQPARSDFRHLFSLARVQGWRSYTSPVLFAPVIGGEHTPTSIVAGASVSSDEGREDADTDSLIPAPPSRPIFKIEGGNRSFLIEKAQKLLADELYTRAGRLVKFIDGRISAVSYSFVQEILDKRADWWKSRQDGDVYPVDCPEPFARALGSLGEWPHMHPLDAIANAPFIRADGSVCEKPGYDERSRILYIPNDAFPRIQPDGDRRVAQDSADLLLRPFGQFPFVSDEARAAFLAHILTEATRLSIDRAPMFWYSAPLASTGKSLLADMPPLIVHGTVPNPRPWPSTPDEIRKALYAYLLQGDRSIFFDNLPRGVKIRTPELCAVLTSDRWTDRKLGASEGYAVVNRAVISASGNNPTPSSDLARRSLVIRMATSETNRTFDIADLRAYVREHRPELLVAALTILCAYRYNHDGFMPPNSLASFEQWSYQVRNPILWLGMGDPVATQETETDDEMRGAGTAFSVLGAAFKERPFTSTDVAQLAASSDTINRALIESGCDEPFSSRRVGYWLRDYRDCTMDGWQLQQFRTRSHGYYRWQLVSTTQNGDLL